METTPDDPHRWLDERAMNVPRAVAKRYCRSYHEYEDFLSIGNHILVLLARKFDPRRVEKNSDFGAYAYKYIAMSIRGIIKDQYKHLNGDYTGVSHCRKVGALVPSYTKQLYLDDLGFEFDDGRNCEPDPGPDLVDAREAVEWLLGRLEGEEDGIVAQTRHLRGSRVRSRAVRMRFLGGRTCEEIGGEFGIDEKLTSFFVRDGLRRMAEHARDSGMV